MRLKSFYAKSMPEAMKMVKDALGDEAIIVASREEAGTVRVTAAVEQMPLPKQQEENTPQKPAKVEKQVDKADDDWLAVHLRAQDEDKDDALQEQLTDTLLKHGVPEQLLDQILSCHSMMEYESLDDALQESLNTLFKYKPIDLDKPGQILMLVGPPGSGKTLAAAKLAARGVLDDYTIGVISTDTLRAGGIEQLEAFTNILHIELQKASSPALLKKQIDSIIDKTDHIIIDSGGYNPYLPEDMKQLAKLIAARPEIEPIAVLPTGIDPFEAADMARVYASVGARRLMPTRIDIARRFGGVLSAAYNGNFAFAEASDTPKVADGLIPLSPKIITRLMVPRSKKAKTSSEEAVKASGKTLKKTVQRKSETV